MRWVMPPASPPTTSAWRIASSSEVLPWSTWPMIGTTGGRSAAPASASSSPGSSAPPAAATRSAPLLWAALGALRTLAAVALLRLLPGRLALLGLPRSRLLARLRAVAGGRRFGLGLLRGSGFGAVRERAGDVVLVDAGGGSLHVKARLLEHGKNLLAGDSALLGYFMNSLLGHSR